MNSNNNEHKQPQSTEENNEAENLLIEDTVEQENKYKKSRIKWSLFFGIIVILMIICVIVINYLSK